MDFHPRSSITELLKAALHQVDGVAAYISIILISVTCLAISLENITLQSWSNSDWHTPLLLFGTLPVLGMLSLRLIYFTENNNKTKRYLNALFIYGFTAYAFCKIFNLEVPKFLYLIK